VQREPNMADADVSHLAPSPALADIASAGASPAPASAGSLRSPTVTPPQASSNSCVRRRTCNRHTPSSGKGGAWHSARCYPHTRTRRAQRRRDTTQWRWRGESRRPYAS
jgi:hypothetical protein